MLFWQSSHVYSLKFFSLHADVNILRYCMVWKWTCCSDKREPVNSVFNLWSADPQGSAEGCHWEIGRDREKLKSDLLNIHGRNFLLSCCIIQRSNICSTCPTVWYYMQPADRGHFKHCCESYPAACMLFSWIFWPWRYEHVWLDLKSICLLPNWWAWRRRIG